VRYSYANESGILGKSVCKRARTVENPMKISAADLRHHMTYKTQSVPQVTDLPGDNEVKLINIFVYTVTWEEMKKSPKLTRLHAIPVILGTTVARFEHGFDLWWHIWCVNNENRTMMIDNTHTHTQTFFQC